MAGGMTVGKRVPLYIGTPRATTTWQKHPDPLVRARDVRRKGGKRGR